MANTTQLTREQADAVCEFLWVDVRDHAFRDDLDELRFTRAVVHLCDAVQWHEPDEDRRDAYQVEVDGELAWLATEALQRDLDEMAAFEADEPEERPWLAPDLAAWVAEQNEQRAATKAAFCAGARRLIEAAEGQLASV